MTAPRLVDFHCHLDLYPDHQAAVARSERDGVFTLTVTTTPKAWARNKLLADKTKHVRAALGIHPQVVGQRAAEIDLWEELLPQTRYVGEVGLDAGPRFYKTLDAQKDVFERVLKACAKAHNRVLTVHTVRTAKAVLDMVEQHLPPRNGRVVLHWFTGTPAEARRAIDMGCYFSVNPVMLASDKQRDLVKALPLDRLLTETDGPFTSDGDRPLWPSDVTKALDQLGRMFGKDRDAMAVVVVNNMKRLIVKQT